MLASTLITETTDGDHRIRFVTPLTDPEQVAAQSVEAARVLGHLNVALSNYPWSPCRQLIIFNQ